MLTKLICRNFKNFDEVEVELCNQKMEENAWNIEDSEKVGLRSPKSV